MKRIRKRITAAVLLAAFCCVMMTGCGSQNTNQMYSQVKESGILTAAVLQDNAPYSWFDAQSGAYSGIEIDILNAVAQSLGVTLNYYPTSQAGLTEAVAAGEADIAIGRIPSTNSGQQVDLSTHYMTGSLYVVTARGRFAWTMNALEGEPIGLSRRLSSDADLELYTIDNTERVYYDVLDTVEQDLLAGTIAGFFCYEEQARELIQTERLQAQTITDYTPERYCIAVQQNNPDMTDAINEVIRTLTENGTIESLILSYRS